MAALVWDQTGEKLYETGVEQGVLYIYNSAATDKTKAYDKGYAWNGLISVSESPSGAEETALYADDDKYLSLRSKEEFGATVEAYMYPSEFEQCDGTASIATGVNIGQQSRSTFGLCYKTIVGNDTELDEHGYKIHIIYGCTASPSEKQYQSVNDSPDAITFSWEISTVPVNVTGFKKTATVVIDSTKADSTKLAALEKILYGSDSEEARLPLPDEIKTLMAA